MSQLIQYFVRLIPPRQGFHLDMTPSEEQIMGEHFAYLMELAAQRKVLIAGPCFDPLFGMAVLNVTSRDEAVEIMNNDPSVRRGLNKYEFQEMRASIQAAFQSPERYAPDPSDRILAKEIIISAPVAEVWRAWTTNDGVRSFFAPNTNIELTPGGPYEIYFNMDVPPGLRGSEGCKVLSFLPEKMLSFEWNAPPEFGLLRGQLTRVVILFDTAGPDTTRLNFFHLGWGSGRGWDKVYEYFDRAWGFVLNSLNKKFSERHRTGE